MIRINKTYVMLECKESNLLYDQHTILCIVTLLKIYQIIFQIKDMDTNIRHLENQIVSLIDTKTSQEKTIKDYMEKLKENFAMIETLKQKLGSYEEKLKHAEQVKILS